jgi:hypothetical protein
VIPLFAKWAEENGYQNWLDALAPHKEVHHAFYLEAVEKIKQMHSRFPKYTYSDESTRQVLEKCSVEVIDLFPARVECSGVSMFEFGGELLQSANDVAKRNFEKEGYSCLFLESRPLHVLFGVFMWRVIQDPSDPKIRRAGIRRKLPTGEWRSQGWIGALMPPDFGTAQYSDRRVEALEKHFAALQVSREDLLAIFDQWLDPSYELRSYLSAHLNDDVARARVLISVLPPELTVRVLNYLAANYWSRYCGWPDMLFYKASDFFLAEVKFSGDGLKEDQKEWIRGNAEELRLPFKLIKVHRIKGSQRGVYP